MKAGYPSPEQMPNFAANPRVLVVTRGSAGDVHPYLAVALALAARGVRTGLITNPYFRETIERSGIDFFPMGDPLPPQDRLVGRPQLVRRVRGTFAWLELLGGAAAEVVPAVDRAIDEFRPDLIFGHHLCLGGPEIASKRGVEWWTGMLAPVACMSVQQPVVFPIGLDTSGHSSAVRRIQNLCTRTTVNAMVDARTVRACAAHGVSASRDVFFGGMLGHPSIAMFSPALRAPAQDDPEGMRIVGFPWPERKDAWGELDPEVRSFLDDGTPPVVAAMGSMYSGAMAPTNARVVEACRSLGERAIVVGGLPSGFSLQRGELQVARAPYSGLFARAAAVVHHGGVGTAAFAMRHGVPVVVTPIGLDQFDIGARIARMGLGVVVLPRSGPRRFARALDRVLHDEGVRNRAGVVRRIVEREDGASAAAEVLVGRLVGRDRSLSPVMRSTRPRSPVSSGNPVPG